MKKLIEYRNGNYKVEVFEDGTKIRTLDEGASNFVASFPESIDTKCTNRCDMKCAFCFIENQKVSCLDDLIDIDKIKEHTLVKSINWDTKEKESNVVKKIYKRKYSGKILKITLENGTTIECTPNHKIYTNKSQKEARTLKIGDEVFCE